MTDPFAFIAAVITLLAVPGPTNTLLAAAGAAAGFRASLKLIPAEVAGYLVSIAVLSAVLQPIATAHPLIPLVSKLGASAYLAWLAFRLWRDADAKSVGAPSPVSPARLFITTLLNPKALVFAFVIFPRTGLTTLGPFAATFVVLATLIGGSWIALGSVIALTADGGATPRRVSQVAALALSVFAVMIATSAVSSVA